MPPNTSPPSAMHGTDRRHRPRPRGARHLRIRLLHRRTSRVPADRRAGLHRDRRGQVAAFTSSLTLLEVLVVPYRAAHLPLAETLRTTPHAQSWAEDDGPRP